MTVRSARVSKVLCAVGVAALLAVTFAAAASAGHSARRSFPSLQKDINALVAAGAPGVVVTARRGHRVEQTAGGFADVRTRTPMRATDLFRTGSLTKTYVATVVLQMVAEGTLSLEDTVERWLPGLVTNGDTITLRQLLNHSSGIPEFDQDPRVLKPYLAGNLGYRWSPLALVKVALSHKASAPGLHHSYSNTNYLLVGLVVEAASHHTLAAELKRRIFTPLHLDATTFQLHLGPDAPYAHGYFTLGKPPATDISALSAYPWAAGAIVSSGADTATFYRALLRGQLLPTKQLDEMKTTLSEGAKTDFPGSRYGLGLESLRLPCGRAWGHGGNYPGYLVYSLTSNDGSRQAVVLLNEDPASLPKSALHEFLKLLVKSYCGAG